MSNYNEYKYVELTETREDMVENFRRGREYDADVAAEYGPDYVNQGGYGGGSSYIKVVFFSLFVVPVFGMIFISILRMM